MTNALSKLSQELESWCNANNLPFMSADELAAEDYVSDEQRKWLLEYIGRWDLTCSENWDDACDNNYYPPIPQEN